MTGRSLSTHLLALVLAVLLPSLSLGAVTAWHMANTYRTTFEERLSDTAQALALAVEREMQAHIAALTTLAASPRLADDDLAGFYLHARGAAEAIGTPVVVIGADLHPRLHTARPFGSQLALANTAGPVRAAAATGRPAVSDLLVGTILRVPVVIVAVPVVRQGRADMVLTAPLAPDRLTALLASQGLSGGGFATLMDSHNVIVARSREAAEFVGHTAPEWVSQGLAEQEAGVLRGRTLAGEDAIFAFRHLANVPGWTVLVAEPLAAYEASWHRPLIALAAGGAATFLAALAAAAWLGRRILRPVRVLTRQAEATAASGGDAPILEDVPSPVSEFERLRQSILRAEARRSLLMREVDHRAKNALAVVQSVLRLTPADEPRSFARAVEARVAALARVHSLLAEEGWSGADLRTAAERELAPYAVARSGVGPLVSVSGPAIVLAPAAVQPLVMMVHELATNAAKHGALSAPGGRVELRWSLAGAAHGDGLLHLQWEESGGPSIPKAPARRGFGIRVIESTVRHQLGGVVELRWAPSGLAVEAAVPLARVLAGGRTGRAVDAAAEADA